MSVDETQRLWERSEENNGHTSVQPATSDSSEKVIELDTVPKASTDVPKEDAVITPRRREASPPRTAPSRDSEIKHDDPFLTKKSSPISAGLENDPFFNKCKVCEERVPQPQRTCPCSHLRFGEDLRDKRSMEFRDPELRGFSLGCSGLRKRVVLWHDLGRRLHWCDLEPTW